MYLCMACGGKDSGCNFHLNPKNHSYTARRLLTIYFVCKSKNIQFEVHILVIVSKLNLFVFFLENH